MGNSGTPMMASALPSQHWSSLMTAVQSLQEKLFQSFNHLGSSSAMMVHDYKSWHGMMCVDST